MNRQLLIVGAALFLGTAIFQAAVQSGRGFEADPFDGIFGLAMFVGLILIVVGAVKGTGTGAANRQQQQQQVVVYTGAPGQDAPAAPRMILQCGVCRTMNEASARFCMECGHTLETAVPNEARSAARRSRPKT